MVVLARILMFLVVLPGALLTGCSTTGGYSSPEYRLPEGSTVELRQILEFPPNSARVFVQQGVAMQGNHVDLWRPHCSFQLKRARGDQPLVREIHPTRFTTGRVEIGVDASLDSNESGHVVSERASVVGNVMVAGLFGSEGPGGPPWPFKYYTTIKLYSEEAPQVDELTCAFDGAPVDRHLTVDEIRYTLGDIADIY